MKGLVEIINMQIKVGRKRDNIKKIKLFCINLFVIFITFGEFIFNTHYSSDDFYCMFNQKGEAIAVTYQSYRVVLGAIYYALDKWGINVVKFQKYIGLIMLILFALAVSLITMIFYNIIEEKMNNCKTLILINVGSLLLIVNVFVSEWVWFALAYIQWGIAVLFSVLAIKLLTKDDALKNYCWALICLIIAAGCYQIAISIYVFLIMAYIYLKWKGKISIEVVKDILKAALIAVLAVLINIVISKILGQINGMDQVGSRVKITNIFDKILMIVNYEKEIWKNAEGMMPNYFLIIVAIVDIGILIYGYIIGKKNRIANFLWVGVIIISGNAVRWLLVLVQGDFWQPARMLVPFMCPFVCFNAMIIHHFKGNKRMITINVIMVCLLLLCNFVEIQINKYDCIKTNTVQEDEMKTITRYINEYEEKNNIQIKYVSVIKDENPSYKYLDILTNKSYYGEMATRSLVTTWSDAEMVKYYLGKEIEELELKDEEGRECFSKKNYDYFSVEDQVKFEGDRVYICAY